MKLWDCFLDKIEKQFGRETITKWVRPLKVIQYDAANLYLKASDSFQQMWFEEHIRPLAKKAFLNNNGRPIKIHLSIGPLETQEKSPLQTQEEKPIRYEQDELIPYFDFEQFVPSESNVLAFEILKNMDQERSYNPIYLYGPPGSGKSHLLQATAKMLSEKGIKTYYVSALTFTNHVVSAIRKGDMQAFRQTYRHLDALIIDDIQQFVRKNATQEELFHTFNTLHTANKQIILGANLAPNFLDGIEERLISRFEWGITLPLQKVTAHVDLLLFLQKRMSFYEVRLEKSLQEYLITLFKEIKALVKAFDALIVHIQLEKIPQKSSIHLSNVKDFIDDFYKKENTQKITPEKIISMVAELFDIKMEDIIGKSQSRDCALPRQIAMYLLRSELKMPYMKIGNVFSRDHSTVMTSVKAIDTHLNGKDKEITYYLQDIQRKLLTFG